MHIVSLALGGCLKAEPVRYGLTEDTGGHITYILGEMEALSRREDIRFAEIVTRQFDEPRLGAVHTQPQEWINSKLVITRVESGNSAYLAKDALRDDRKAFTDALIAEFRGRDRLPDLIHAHFADAADVAMAVEKELGIPFIYTAHSLGIDKRAALAERSETIEARIAEEDRAIAKARAVIGSSRDECERQLAAYPSARIGRINRLVPGIDRGRSAGCISAASDLVAPFLRDPAKPMVLAIARPVHKKNLAALVDAFAASSLLRDRCNLVILAGLRDDLDTGNVEQQEIQRELVARIDRYDLYGSVAYPKSHSRDDVQGLYALAASTRGVFVNPALMEPYGLTIVEAAAHGLPVVATKIGGPQDIIAELEHGLLVDPCNTAEIGRAIERLVTERPLWDRCSKNAQVNSLDMNWDKYAAGFTLLAEEILAEPERKKRPTYLLVSDLDNTLTGCPKGIMRFGRFMQRQGEFGFVVATGRSIVEARRLVRDWKLPLPLAWITSVGTEVYLQHNGELVLDQAFARIVERGWDPHAVDSVVAGFPELVPQPSYEQRPHKRSYFVEDTGCIAKIERALRLEGIAARVVFSHGRLLDILPPAAGKAAAMRYVAGQFGIASARVFAAGDSGNDVDMLTACENAILVGNHAEEVASLAARPNVYRSRRQNASGALEGVLAHHRARQLRLRQNGRIPA
ncbi:HAD-IIB family hydrolase [Aurantiacibacter rhizosphaerae]|uniref:HAD-IIB family hydrolase n=1 Tax=Aurantiacibacter rhizosphaerae TaxID=2691582 RepID=UPI001365E702|nr:HAD-IIB family hydrolase [Aurantiacibacter rhizosphaerae]